MFQELGRILRPLSVYQDRKRFDVIDRFEYEAFEQNGETYEKVIMVAGAGRAEGVALIQVFRGELCIYRSTEAPYMERG